MRVMAGFSTLIAVSLAGAATPCDAACDGWGGGNCITVRPPPGHSSAGTGGGQSSSATSSSSPAAPSSSSSSSNSSSTTHSGSGGTTWSAPEPQLSSAQLAAIALRERGIAAANASDFQAAADAFRKALALTPDDADLVMRLRQADAKIGAIRETERRRAKKWHDSDPAVATAARGARPAPQLDATSDHDSPHIGGTGFFNLGGSGDGSRHDIDLSSPSAAPRPVSSVRDEARSSSDSGASAKAAKTEERASWQARCQFDQIGCTTRPTPAQVPDVPQPGPGGAVGSHEEAIPPEVAEDRAYKDLAADREAAQKLVSEKQTELNQLRLEQSSEKDSKTLQIRQIKIAETAQQVQAARSRERADWLNQQAMIQQAMIQQAIAKRRREDLTIRPASLETKSGQSVPPPLPAAPTNAPPATDGDRQ